MEKLFKHLFQSSAKQKNEITQYYKEHTLVRLKRKPHNLPNVWDDYTHTKMKNWKFQSKKIKQHGFNQKIILKIKRKASKDAFLL